RQTRLLYTFFMSIFCCQIHLLVCAMLKCVLRVFVAKPTNALRISTITHTTEELATLVCFCCCCCLTVHADNACKLLLLLMLMLLLMLEAQAKQCSSRVGCTYRVHLAIRL